MGRSNLVERLVTVVVSDPYHAIHLIEVKTRVRREMDQLGMWRYRVDKNQVEAIARERAAARGLGKHPLTSGRDETWPLDVVGVLVAVDDKTAPAPGRIIWADEIETVEAVTI